MVAGGIGSGLADVLSGYGHWAPFTLIIKGIMGLVVGKIAGEMKDNGGFLKARNFVATIVGGIWMVFGYFIGGGILKSSFAISAVSIPENCVQAAGGIIVFFAVGIAFYRAKIYKLVS